MKISYDPAVDAMYIWLSDKKSTRTEVVSNDLMVDYSGKKLIGIEILDVSKKLPNTDLESIELSLPTYKGRIAPR